MRNRLGQIMAGYHFTPVENTARPGTPDCWWVNAWAELKDVPRWPGNPNDKLLLHHYTTHQCDWLCECYETGGRCWLIVKVGIEWLLFDKPVAFRLVGSLTRAQMYQFATASLHERRQDFEHDLMTWLTSPRGD
jgi:hypothetical protein